MNYSQNFNKFQIIIFFCLTVLIILPLFPGLVNGKTEKSLTKIMGKTSECSAEQMYTYLIKNNDKNGNNPITKEYAVSFVKTTIKEAKKEGVRADIAFSLMMHETGFLNFTGDVDKSQNNFAGLGTTGGGVKGAKFKSMKIGIRAVIQHLKCYASKEKLNQKCVDPRWNESLRGKAEYVEYLGFSDNPNNTGWAYPGKGYGEKILTHLNRIKNIKTDEIIQEDRIIFQRQKAKNISLSFLFNILLICLILLILRKLSNSNKKNNSKRHYR